MIILNFENIEICEMCGSKTAKVLGQRLNQSQGLNPKNKMGISVSVIQCNTCNLIYSNPQPTPLNIQDFYGVEAENYWREEYFNISELDFFEEIQHIKNLLSYREGMKALDIGAGIGKCMIALEKAGFDSYGIESSKSFYNKAITRMNIKKEKLLLSMIEDVSYEKNTFDLITYGAVFEHLYHPAKVLEKSLEWLSPNGIIHIEVPSSRHFIAKIINLYYRIRGTNYVTNISPMHSPFHLYEFDLLSFEALAKKLNYEIVRVDYYVGPIYFIPKIFHKVLRWYMKKTNTGMQFTIYLKQKNENV